MRSWLDLIGQVPKNSDGYSRVVALDDETVSHVWFLHRHLRVSIMVVQTIRKVKSCFINTGCCSHRNTRHKHLASNTMVAILLITKFYSTFFVLPFTNQIVPAGLKEGSAALISRVLWNAQVTDWRLVQPSSARR